MRMQEFRVCFKKIKNTYLRASMGQNRLSALALVHINLDVDTDAKLVPKYFVREIGHLSLQIFVRKIWHNVIL